MQITRKPAGESPASSHHLQAGRLVDVRLDVPRSAESCYLAWNGRCKGRALAWWIERLDRPDLLASGDPQQEGAAAAAWSREAFRMRAQRRG